MKKKVMAGALAVMLVASTTVFAASTSEQITVNRNQMKVVVNGTNVTADNFLYDGTTYLPLRAVSTALGADVAYDGTTQTATITSGSSKEFTMNATTADVYYELLSVSQSVYDELNSFNYAAFGDSDATNSEIKDSIDKWATDAATLKDDADEQKERIAKYEAKDEFYKTSFVESDTVVTNLEKEIDIFKTMATDAKAYISSKSSTTASAVNSDMKQIIDLNESIYDTCEAQHAKYMTRITE